jgi:hypothetical protein
MPKKIFINRFNGPALQESAFLNNIESTKCNVRSRLPRIKNIWDARSSKNININMDIKASK